MKFFDSRSLIRQTIGIVVIAQIFSAAFLGGAALLHERHTRLRALDVRLQGRSDSLLGAIQDAEDPDDNVMIDPAELKLPDDDVYAVYNKGGRLLGSSRVAPPVLVERRGGEFRDALFGTDSYRVLQRDALRVIDRAEHDGAGLKRPVTIVYASPEGHLWHEIFEAVRFSLLAITLVTGLTVFLVALLLRKALFPLKELASAAAQIYPPALVFAAPASVMRVRELRPLAEVLMDTSLRFREAFYREHRFFADAAHELKTAIAVVRSSVQLLMLKRRDIDEYAEGLRRVLEDNSRVEALVGQMLQLASIEEQTIMQTTGVDLSELTAIALEQLRPIAEERGVPLSYQPSLGMLVALSPERALSLVLNLVMNAIQHSPCDRPVKVSLGRNQGKVMLEVRDSGAGIAADALPHIFERFYREDRSRSRDTGGTGLGLSICKSIVQGAAGSIAIQSLRDEGTRVTVILPASNDSLDIPALEPTPARNR